MLKCIVITEVIKPYLQSSFVSQSQWSFGTDNPLCTQEIEFFIGSKFLCKNNAVFIERLYTVHTYDNDKITKVNNTGLLLHFCNFKLVAHLKAKVLQELIVKVKL